MGTRSLVSFYDGKVHLVTVYRQFDGYPDGRGLELATFIAGGKLGNGISGEAKIGSFFNGFDDLAAQWIRAEKGDDVGNVYIYPKPTSKYWKGAWEEYYYIVRKNKNGIFMEAYEICGPNLELFFVGTPQEYIETYTPNTKEAE